jgi:N-acetylneuraminate lyase
MSELSIIPREIASMTNDQRLTGLVAATFTPMREDGTLNLNRVGPVVEHLRGQGISALYVVGSTGEGVSLATPERQQAVEAFIEAAAGRMPVVVHVGHNSLAEARAAAAHAERVGATAISAVPPSYFKPESLDVLVASMAEIAAAAPTLPFYYYHIPQMNGVSADMVEFLRVAGERIPTLAGLKFTSPLLCEMLACIEFQERRFDVLHGRDEMLLAGLAMGAAGAVGSTYNFAAPLYQRVLAAFARGDLAEARCWQARAMQMIRTVVKYHGFSGQKAVMKMIGLDCGPTRLPLTPLRPGEADDLRRELEALGFFQWIQ